MQDITRSLQRIVCTVDGRRVRSGVLACALPCQAQHAAAPMPMKSFESAHRAVAPPMFVALLNAAGCLRLAAA